MAPDQRPGRGGFTLLEVILALGVLAAAVAVVGEVTRLAHKNAERAALEGDALLVADSVMAQLLAGLLPLAEAPPTPWEESDGDPAWRYSVTVAPTDLPELLAATVAVEEITANRNPTTVTLVRWFPDPSEAPATDATTDGGSSS